MLLQELANARDVVVDVFFDGEEAVAARRDGVATRGILTRLFAPRRRLQSIGSPLPDVLFWKILEFWRTDRDP